MSDIEELLRQHTDNVDEALSGFEGQITSIKDAVNALQASVRQTPANPAVSRGGGIVVPGPETPAGPSASLGFGLGDHRNITITSEAREQLGAIMRGQITAAMREASDPDGGFLVPEVIRGQIEALVLRQSPIRRLARVVDFVSSPKVVLPVNLRGVAAGWVGENDERTETDTPALGAVTPPGGTLYALPKATEELVDDAIVNLEQFLEENVVDAFAEKESEAFIAGNGINKPAGFLAPDRPPTEEADAVRALGTLQAIVAAGLDGAALVETLLTMIFSLKAGYRQAPGVAWLGSTDFLSKLVRVKDGEGRPLYLPSLREGVPGTLLGYPVVEAEHMDNYATGKYPLAFGNWQRGYVIGDRTQLNVLRDPYTTKGQIKWYFRKRVHGAVLNSEAIKVMKTLTA